MELVLPCRLGYVKIRVKWEMFLLKIAVYSYGEQADMSFYIGHRGG